MDPTTLVSGKNAALAAAIVVVLSMARSLVPKVFEARRTQRLLPLLPVLLGVLSLFVGFGEAGEAPNWQAKLVTGLLTGAASSSLYKIGRTTLLGQGLGSDVAAAPAAAPPSSPEGSG